jgi:hypothetical protein
MIAIEYSVRYVLVRAIRREFVVMPPKSLT